MPFEPKDFETFATYKAKLNAEEKNVGGNGHFALYKDFQFKTGPKRSVLLVGKAKPPAEVVTMMKDASVKCTASGACAKGPDGLVFVVENGSLSPLVLDSVGLASGSSVRDALPFKPAQAPTDAPAATAPGGANASPAANGAAAANAQKPSVMIGGGGKQFVAQRTALLKFTQDAIARMQTHQTAATALATNVDRLLDPIYKGQAVGLGAQRFRDLAVKYQTEATNSLKSVEDLNSTDGPHIAKERKVNPGLYGVKGADSKKLLDSYGAIFKEATENSYKRTSTFSEARNTYRFILDNLVQAIEIIDKGGVSADTGAKILDELLVLMDGIETTCSRSAGTNCKDTRDTMADPKLTPERKQEILGLFAQNIEIKKTDMADSVAQLKAVTLRVMNVVKSFESDPRVQERFQKFKAISQLCVGYKRDHQKYIAETDQFIADNLQVPA